MNYQEFTIDDVSFEVHHSGVECYTIFDGCFIHRLYIGYSVEEARECFYHSVKSLETEV